MEVIHAYRVRGHLMADTDPLEFSIRRHPDLDITEHRLTLWDLDREFAVGGFAGQPHDEAARRARRAARLLLPPGRHRIHAHPGPGRSGAGSSTGSSVRPSGPTRAEQLHVLERLNAAEAFENFLQTKYVGQKRFSLEGGESAIPILDEILQGAAEDGLDEVVIGMPHRGRLNVLANIVGKSYGADLP